MMRKILAEIAMDIETLRQTLEQAGLASLAAGFTIGFLFSFNPVALAAIPVSLALVTKAHAPQRAVLYGGMFIFGDLQAIEWVILGHFRGLAACK